MNQPISKQRCKEFRNNTMHIHWIKELKEAIDNNSLVLLTYEAFDYADKIVWHLDKVDRKDLAINLYRSLGGKV